MVIEPVFQGENMRKILFKAKLKNWKTNPQKTLHYIAVDSMTDWGLPNEFRCYEIDPDTLCEFTGMLEGKSKKKIWEHDIIKGTFWGFMMPVENYVFEISWHDDVAGWYKNVMDDDNEVIGNIFDNPELLEK